MPPASESEVIPGSSTEVSARPASRNPVNWRSAASRRASAFGPGGEHLDDREAGLVGMLGQVFEQLAEAGGDALRPGRAGLGLEPPGRVPEQVAEQHVVGGEEAVLLAGEEFVERLSRDAGDADHVDHAGLGVAALGDDLDHRLQDAGALGIRHGLPRQPVPAPWQPLAQPSRAST